MRFVWSFPVRIFHPQFLQSILWRILSWIIPSLIYLFICLLKLSALIENMCPLHSWRNLHWRNLYSVRKSKIRIFDGMNDLLCRWYLIDYCIKGDICLIRYKAMCVWFYVSGPAHTPILAIQLNYMTNAKCMAYWFSAHLRGTYTIYVASVVRLQGTFCTSREE
jgi:hypothetical protein